VEVYGLSYEELQSVLGNHATPNLVGNSFGIVKLRIDGMDYDFNIPRTENKIGIKHTDFDVQLRPDLTPREAAERRDLTINSMFVNLADMLLHDPYHGFEDLQEGTLRHTSAKFAEDPLRVLRIMQLLPRKGKTVAPETLALCQSLSPEFSTLAKERVYEEWNKLLFKSERPSKGLQFLVDSGWIEHFPELGQLRYVGQNLAHHPEGNVWNHNQLVIDAAAALRAHLPEEWKLAYMYGALLHDAGKALTTQADLTSHGHESAGIPLARQFMQRLTNEYDITSKVIKLVGAHGRPWQLYESSAPKPAWKRLHNEVPLHIIAYLSKADSSGRLGYSLSQPHGPSERALAYYEEFGPEKIPAVLNGDDIIALGVPEGRRVGELLRHAYDVQIEEGISDKEILLERIKETL
jgi:tRNA nucleotidyltransferase (CCA-adding enzyme)